MHVQGWILVDNYLLTFLTQIIVLYKVKSILLVLKTHVFFQDFTPFVTCGNTQIRSLKSLSFFLLPH